MHKKDSFQTWEIALIYIVLAIIIGLYIFFGIIHSKIKIKLRLKMNFS